MNTIKYPDGIYFNPCPCSDEDLYDSGKKEGYSEGYDEGYSEGTWNGEEEGEERGRSEAGEEFNERIDELEKQLEQYSHLVEEDEYLDRTGMDTI